MELRLRRLFLISLAAFGVIAIIQMTIGPGLVTRFYPLPEDQGSAWYYWQLGAVTISSRVSFWLGYALHQIVVFALLIIGRRIEPNRNSDLARRFNVLLLTANLAFVALHLVQTHIWYDGLAQDMPIWTSQGSVIVMLVLVLFLEMPRRGLFFGKWTRVPQGTYRFVRRWHGLYISWAIVYTFWFHPMEGNWGLMSGFVYMYLLFIQMSIPGTRIHMHPKWIVLLEAGVIIHGTLITVYKDNPIWPMFLFGFVAMFSFTQVYGLSKIRWVRLIGLGVYIVGAALVYGLIRGFDHLYELTFIPVALYGGAIGLWLVGKGVERFPPIRRRLAPTT